MDLLSSLLQPVFDWLAGHENIISAIVGLIIISGGILGSVQAAARSRQERREARPPKAVTSAPNETRPSIAVLPFDSLSTDPEQGYIADALSEDLTTLLSRTPQFFVIARNSTFAYKGRHVDVRQVAKELGVRYVIEGSVRPIGERMRINVQLIDGERGQHLWAERFDTTKEELFASQDDVAHSISVQLLNPLVDVEVARASRLHPRDIDAWLLTQRALHVYFFAGPETDRFLRATKLLDEALGLDPNYASALALSALILSSGIVMQFSQDPIRDTALAFERGRKAMEVAPLDPMVLWGWGVVNAFLVEPSKGIPFLERAVAIDVNNAHALTDLGYQLGRVGRAEEGKALIQRAFKLSPKDPRHYIWHFFLGAVDISDPERCLVHYERSLELHESYTPSWFGKIIVLAGLGRLDEARAAVARLKEINPKLDDAAVRAQMRMGSTRDGRLREVQMHLLQKVGLLSS